MRSLDTKKIAPNRSYLKVFYLFFNFLTQQVFLFSIQKYLPRGINNIKSSFTIPPEPSYT